MKLPLLDDAIKYGPWSLSKADLATQCGLKFHLKYIEKKKEPEVVRPESRVGSAAHKVLELTLQGKDLASSFITATRENKLTTNEAEDLMLFEGNIKEFLERIKKFQTKNPIDKQMVETKFGITLDLRPTTFFGKDVFFRGVFDYAMKLQDKNLIIIDHKTGRPSDDISKHDNQLKSYGLVGMVLFPEINGVQSAIHYVKDGSIKWNTLATVQEINDDYISWFVTYLNSSVSTLTREAKVGWQCNYCGYSGQCEKYQESLK